AIVAGDPELGADGERGGAEPSRRNPQLEDLVEARRRLPLDRLLHELKVQRPGDELPQHAAGAEELVDADVDVLAVAGVEDHLLRVAFDVANSKVIAKGSQG